MNFESDFSMGGGASSALSRRRKAALIVQMLISDGSKLSLSQLPEHLQEALALELGAIRLVDRDTVNAVADEFAQVLEAVGLSAPGGAPAAINALAGNLTPSLANRLQARFGQIKGGDPWAKIAELSEGVINDILMSESIQVAAVTLSKLPVETAATVLSALPGERARRITLAVSQTAEIEPDAVARIGNALVDDYCTISTTAFDKTPVARVGEILNYSPAATREALLEGLDTDDAHFAKDVRKAIFTFADIPTRVAALDIPNCIRAIDSETMATALAGALASEGSLNDTAEFILANISQRMAASMREDATAKAGVKMAVAEDAMKAITTAIRAQADLGEIIFLDPSDEDDMEEAAA